jgi:DNA-directed RNA polymerase subunit RPC12/RpoP
MANLTCAACGTKGEVGLRPGDGAFDIRGRWPDGHRPVVRCSACGHGLIVNPRFGVMVWWPKTTVIPEDVWLRIQHVWREQVELRCRECGKPFTTERALEDHSAAKHALTDDESPPA